MTATVEATAVVTASPPGTTIESADAVSATAPGEPESQCTGGPDSIVTVTVTLGTPEMVTSEYSTPMSTITVTFGTLETFTPDDSTAPSTEVITTFFTTLTTTVSSGQIIYTTIETESETETSGAIAATGSPDNTTSLTPVTPIYPNTTGPFLGPTAPSVSMVILNSTLTIIPGTGQPTASGPAYTPSTLPVSEGDTNPTPGGPLGITGGYCVIMVMALCFILLN